MIQSDSIRITPEILRSIARIDEFKGAWRSLSALSPERLNALRRVATVESIGSSTRIEGSNLSDREVEELLRRVRIERFENRDEQEVAGYADAMDLVFESWPDLPFTENHISQLHGILLRHSDKDAWHRGRYKQHPNHVSAFDEDGRQIGIVFETASPLATPVMMAELVEWFRNPATTQVLHPLLAIGIAVVVFLEIHPFQDGNGRLSRILTTLLLLQSGYVFVPFGSLESVIEREKEAYYLALRQTQSSIRTTSPDWNPWIRFFLDALESHVSILERKLERERLVLSALPDLTLKILEYVKEHGRITMGDAVALTGVSRDTLKPHFRELIRRGHLARHGAGRGVWYSLA